MTYPIEPHVLYTQQLSPENARHVLGQLTHNMQEKIDERNEKLLWLQPIGSAHSPVNATKYRVAVNITLLKQLFADDFSDWGPGWNASRP